MRRGDVILVRFPHPSGVRGKRRPAVVVQSDGYTGAVSTLVVAEVTTNLSMAGAPACLFVDLGTPEGKAAGLLQNSVVSCLLLATVDANRVAASAGIAVAGDEAETQQLPEGGAGPAVSGFPSAAYSAHCVAARRIMFGRCDPDASGNPASILRASARRSSKSSTPSGHASRGFVAHALLRRPFVVKACRNGRLHA